MIIANFKSYICFLLLYQLSHSKICQSVAGVKYDQFNSLLGGFLSLGPTVRPEVSSLLAAGSQPLPLGIRVEVGSG